MGLNIGNFARMIKGDPKYCPPQARSRLCAYQGAVLSQAWCELVLQLLDRIGPLERLSGLIVAGNKVENVRP
jgi:hypothetical protein